MIIKVASFEEQLAYWVIRYSLMETLNYIQTG